LLWPFGLAEPRVYFFRESSEDRSDTGEGPRVVRVGTHALKAGARTTLWTGTVVDARECSYRRRLFASTMLRSPGVWAAATSPARVWRIELRQDRLEAPQARRQREAVALNRLARSFLLGVAHAGIIIRLVIERPSRC
jgi:hypothetical protein